MNFLRKHWYDFGGVLAAVVIILVCIYHASLSSYELLMWLSLVALFAHQLEEYRIVGTFPGTINKILFKSNQPDRYPLNTNTSLIINVYLGWTICFLAAVTGQKFIWLGMAAIITYLGNVIIHTLVINIKGKMFYNAGMATALLLFAPCIFFFFMIIYQDNLATVTDYVIGILLGIVFTFFGIIKPVTWLADKNTTYIFENRNLLAQDRKKRR